MGEPERYSSIRSSAAAAHFVGSDDWKSGHSGGWRLCRRMARQARQAALLASQWTGACPLLCADKVRQGRRPGGTDPAVLGRERGDYGFERRALGADGWLA